MPEEAKEIVKEDIKASPNAKVEKKPEVSGSLEAKNWAEGIKLARENAKKRKFDQTWDLAINVKGLDLKKPENRINTDIVLPGGRGKKLTVAVIADSLANEAKSSADFVMDKVELTGIAGKKKRIKELAESYDWFLGEVTLMAQIGKILGQYFGPRGKMPRPLPPKAKVQPFVERMRKSSRVTLKETPVIHVAIGTESMKDEDIAKNAEAIFSFVKGKLPKGLNSIKNVYIKLTMGKPVKVEAR